MRFLIFLAILVSAYFGYEASDWYGLATGLIAPLALGSSILIFIGRADDMSINRDLRIKQSMGGFLNLIICSICLYIGGWKLGWLWVVAGYMVGTGISFFITKPTLKSIEESSNKMIESFVSNASSNLGYEPDENSINFLEKNSEISALIWKMLGEAGANSGIGLNNKWSMECDYFYKNFVKDGAFKSSKPGAHALIRYAIYLCDGNSEEEPRCSNPIDDF